ncbi:MAG: hypothetical protein U5N58_08450 [Actinomycetota bacterium]|nr:hypothetical protein [Actinomycetota bacterium]
MAEDKEKRCGPEFWPMVEEFRGALAKVFNELKKRPESSAIAVQLS